MTPISGETKDSRVGKCFLVAGVEAFERTSMPWPVDPGRHLLLPPRPSRHQLRPVGEVFGFSRLRSVGRIDDASVWSGTKRTIDSFMLRPAPVADETGMIPSTDSPSSRSPFLDLVHAMAQGQESDFESTSSSGSFSRPVLWAAKLGQPPPGSSQRFHPLEGKLDRGSASRSVRRGRGTRERPLAASSPRMSAVTTWRSGVSIVPRTGSTSRERVISSRVGPGQAGEQRPLPALGRPIEPASLCWQPGGQFNPARFTGPGDWQARNPDGPRVESACCPWPPHPPAPRLGPFGQVDPGAVSQSRLGSRGRRG